MDVSFYEHSSIGLSVLLNNRQCLFSAITLAFPCAFCASEIWFNPQPMLSYFHWQVNLNMSLSFCDSWLEYCIVLNREDQTFQQWFSCSFLDHDVWSTQWFSPDGICLDDDIHCYPCPWRQGHCTVVWTLFDNVTLRVSNPVVHLIFWHSRVLRLVMPFNVWFDILTLLSPWARDVDQDSCWCRTCSTGHIYLEIDLRKPQTVDIKQIRYLNLLIP